MSTPAELSTTSPVVGSKSPQPNLSPRKRLARIFGHAVDQSIMWMVCRLWRVFLVYFSTLSLAALIFSYAEGVNLFDSAYWTSVTANTVGYGDIAPKTVIGKLLVMVFAPLWVLLFPATITTNFIMRFFPDPHLFSHLEQLWVFRMLKWIAQALLIIAQQRGVADQLPPVPDAKKYGIDLDTDWAAQQAK